MSPTPRSRPALKGACRQTGCCPQSCAPPPLAPPQSTVLPPRPPSVHGTSQRGTHNVSSAAIAPSSEGSVPSNWLLSTILRAAAACTASEHSPSTAASLSHGSSQRGTRNLLSAVSAPSSEGRVPLSWLLSKFLRRRRREKRSQHSPPLPPPPPSVHGTSQVGTHNIPSAVSAPSSEGSVPLSWLLGKFLRAAASACALSTVLPPPPPSVHGTSQVGTHSTLNAVYNPSSVGTVPVSWRLPRFLHRTSPTGW
jgi:hypothetical protein